MEPQRVRVVSDVDSGDARPFHVVGLGVNTIDVIAVVERYPEPDTKVPMQALEMQGGGMTATAMVACARLGLRARYVGKIGSDHWGEMALTQIANEGIDVGGVIRTGGPGHVSLVLVDAATGERRLAYRRPQDYDIQPSELERAVITSGRLLHIDGVDAAAAMQAIDWAREAGMIVTMDGERIVPGIEDVWPRVDLLVCNPRFLAAVTGIANHRQALRALAAAGPPRVAVTLADEGVLGFSEGEFAAVPGFDVQPLVDTNGAGDVFHGACAVGELRGWPLEWTLTVANAVAAMKCRALGGRGGIPRLNDVIEFLAGRGYRELSRALSVGRD